MATKGKKRGPKARVFTPEEREKVKQLVALGTSHRVIGKLLMCEPRTIRSNFREEIDEALATINAQIGHGVVARALSGDNAASFFWLKTHGGPEWKEKAIIEHTGKDGGPIKLSVEARAAKIRQLLDIAAKRKAEELALTAPQGENVQPG